MNRPLWLAGGMLLLAMPLMGMKCTATGDASCSTGGRGCTVKGSVQGQWESLKGMSAATGMNLASSFDAAEFDIDVAESTVTVPQTGQVTLELVNGPAGAVRASRTFGWVRFGNTIRLADPAMVNAWAQQNGSDADTVKYQLAAFQPTGQSAGLNTLTATSRYNGEVESSVSTTWRGPQCPEATGSSHQNLRYCGPR